MGEEAAGRWRQSDVGAILLTQRTQRKQRERREKRETGERRNSTTAKASVMGKQPNEITEAIIGAAMTVHRELGPGMLESAYEACLAYELIQQGHAVQRQMELPLKYRDITLECGYRLDLLVDDSVVVEVKAAQALHPLHEAQLLSYLKMSGRKVGLLINFNVTLLKNGIRRVVNGLAE